MDTGEDLDTAHDAFGGAPSPPSDHDVDWRPDKPRRNPARKWIAAGVAAVAIATGAFFGMRTAASNSNTAAANGPPAGAQGGGFGGPGGPRMQGDGAFGVLQSVDGSTLTLQDRDGQTVKVTTTASTQVTKVVNGTAQPSSLSDLTVGQLTIVRGTAGSDGTVAATAIRQGGGPGGPGGGPGGAPPQNARTA